MLHILVVDDDPTASQNIPLWLRQQGFEVTTVTDASDGLAALRQGHFDLMMIDIFMTNMQGFDSVRLFHNSAPDIPLIAMSGYAFAEGHAPAPDFLRMALALGAMRCLRRPFMAPTLFATVDECMVEQQTRLARTADRQAL